MLHKTSQERYEKLKRVFARLMEHFNTDDLDDFVQTANSLCEWIKRDDTLDQEQKDAIERFTVDRSLDWQICHQIANRQKHLGADRHLNAQLAAGIPVVKGVHTERGLARGFVHPPSSRIYAAGDDIQIELDGGPHSAVGFVVRTYRHFHYTFEVAPIPLDQRSASASSLMEILSV
jgi:hypothetical protein